MTLHYSHALGKVCKFSCTIWLNFEEPRGLEFSINKTRVDVFERHWSHTPILQYCQLDVQQHEFFKYLGIVFYASKGLSLAVDHLAIAGQKAMVVHVLRNSG